MPFRGSQANLPQLPLHEKIAQFEAGNAEGAYGVATDTQIENTCKWLVDHLMFLAVRVRIVTHVINHTDFVSLPLPASQAEILSLKTVTFSANIEV